MKPLSIGIVGGAGPKAGALLLDRIITLASTLYGCRRDEDFPKITLINTPFSNMLSEELDNALLQKELEESLSQLRASGAERLAIACNTLHIFLNPIPRDLVHMPEAVAETLRGKTAPLVLCTSTSARFGLHKRYFPCSYPTPAVQQEIDRIIGAILEGKPLAGVTYDLFILLLSIKEYRIVLGCTELSLLADRLRSISKEIIDPLDILARKLLKICFSEKAPL